jgi:hypothetical protein
MLGAGTYNASDEPAISNAPADIFTTVSASCDWPSTYSSPELDWKISRLEAAIGPNAMGPVVLKVSDAP